MGGVKMAAALMMLCVCLSAGLMEQAAAQRVGSQLTQGQTLYSGQYLEAGEYRLVMQADCNLVLYRDGDKPQWASLTAGDFVSQCSFTLQDDGNAVIYSVIPDFSPDQAVWDTQTCCRNDGDHVLVLQLDGNLVIYNGSGQAIWDSGINGRQ